LFEHSDDPFVARHKQYVEAVMAGAVETVVSLFRSDAILMPPNDRTVYGESELREWHEEYFSNFTITSLQETEREVKIIGDWGVERWTYKVAIDAIKGSETIRDEGRFLKTWTREPDGIWRIVYAIFNSVQPVGSGTSRFLATVRKP